MRHIPSSIVPTIPNLLLLSSEGILHVLADLGLRFSPSGTVVLSQFKTAEI